MANVGQRKKQVTYGDGISALLKKIEKEG